MRTHDKLKNIEKNNLILEKNYLWGDKINSLSENHIKYVLGIELPLNESYYGNPKLIQTIIAEQMIYEDFLKSLKDFAKEKINTVIDKINDWKESAAFIYKLITNPELLKNFTANFWKTFQQSTLGTIKTFLNNVKLDGMYKTIENVVNKITNLTGFKKFLAATAFASVSKYMIDKLKSLPSDKITSFISDYLSESFLTDIINKLTDFKSYLGVLQPIIGTVQFLFKVLEPTINKFKAALTFNKKDDEKIDFSPAA